jgi:hypothetical protein
MVCLVKPAEVLRPLHDDVITAYVASYSIFVHLGHDVHID